MYSNIIFLSLMQATNYIIPLVAIPYLVRVLGDKRFGLVMFAQIFMQYFLIFVDFGFELTATREISIHRNDKQKMSDIFCCVMSIKAFLLLLSLVVMAGVVFSFPRFRDEWELYFLSFGMVVGQMLFPIWFFQGIERMRYVMYFNLVSKTLFTVLVFFVVHRSEDYRMCAIVNSGGSLLAGILSLIVVLEMNVLTIVRPKLHSMVTLVKKTRDVFYSNVGGSLYMTSTPFVLGVVTGKPELVGYYTVAEKVVRGIRYSITPVTQALFPYFSKRFLAEDLRNSIRILFKLLRFLTLPLLTMMVFVLGFSTQLVSILTGGINPSTITNIRLISGVLLLGTFNNVIGVLGMLNLGMETQYRNSIILCGFFNIIVSSVGSYFFQDIGASFSVLATEMLLMILLLFQIRRRFIYG